MLAFLSKITAILLTLFGISTEPAPAQTAAQAQIPTPILSQSIPSGPNTLAGTDPGKNAIHMNKKADFEQKQSDPGKLSAYQQWVTPSYSSINLRTKPSTNAPILKQAYTDEQYPIVSKQGDWYQIAVASNQNAWVSASVVHPTIDTTTDLTTEDTTTDTPADTTTSKTTTATNASNKKDSLTLAATINQDTLSLLDGPGSEFHHIAKVSRDDRLEPVLVSGNYTKVIDPDGESGWLPTSSVRWYREPIERMRQGKDLTETADSTMDGLLSGKTIVIDPGHGGTDTGAIGKITPIYERDVNLACALVLEQKLKAAGANVIMTRTTDEQTVSLADRAKLSNDNHADAFVSIHQNMFEDDPSIHGTSSYYYQSDVSHTLASDIEKQLLQEFHEEPENSHTGVINEELYVLHHNTQPATLIEGCFLSNPEELANSVSVDYQDKLAEGIFKGLLQFFGKEI
jgi:N-acetylmuramoyl-L-alanine amidase